ncbi:MAG: UDP-N-acetylmuramoyl-L-alanyl-D-glutamate--2,6-diaminopimelate ligase [Robiginitomaculum sp.]|nr:MAG: UDP-N-acetylmuramoyl-L-alanyl-D-glutamate--2,6-diaminopimelate ligase [Robiginitomaculum sp.]
MKLSTLIAPRKLLNGYDPEISSLCLDSRLVREGSLFAALPGELVDGRDYIESALAKGASAILSLGEYADLTVPYIQSDNPRLDFAHMVSKFYAGQPEMLVAMTGTNGKSSTVEFLRQIWAYAGLNAACFGTLGITTNTGVTPLSHTTPDVLSLHQTLQNLARDGITHAGMEASSHGLKQYRLDGVKLSAVGFTNLTQDHFDYHPDMEDYFTAKARLFTELAPKSIPAVINVDGEYGQRMAELAQASGLEVMRVGWSGDDLRICEITPRSASQSLTLVWDGERINIELPLAGEFQVLNAVSALGLAVKTGVSREVALEAVTHLTGVAGRMEKAGVTATGAPVFIDFAHTPDGLEKLLRGLRPHTMGRVIVVFGCGGDRDPDKRAKMGAIAAKFAEHAIVTDDNPRSEVPAIIRKAVMVGCPEADEIGDRAEAIAHGILLLKRGDCLVIAGKGHESGQIVGDEIIPFRDVSVAREILAKARQK